MDYINSQVAGYEKIREVVFRNELPVSLAGKVLKRELKKEALAERKDRNKFRSRNKLRFLYLT